MKLRDYVLRRFLVLPLLIVVATIVVFSLIRVGGSPIASYIEPGMSPEEVQRVEQRLGADKPLPVQYFAWVNGVLHGDLGWSSTSNAPVADVFLKKATATFELAILAAVLAVAAGIAAGTFAARHRNRWPDHLTRVLAVSGASMPTFWFGLMVLTIFWAGLNWFPVGRSDPTIWSTMNHPTGFYTVDALLAGSWTAFRDAIWHVILPALVLGYTATAIIARMMRTAMVEELKRDYVDAARAKGLPERVVVRSHVRRNALIPTITVIGLLFGTLIEGAVVVEIIFQWPGLGSWLAEAVLNGDQASTMAFVLFAAVLFLVLNLVVDVMYAHFDRRVELGD
ncbi:ABC transporter permease [Desertimonas flava]|uniref:ABC transporter permease n=1 Tax=Desertimonas flava TaxID=2064846 RepID=UPI0023F470E5|nr:ABC transporter permease [Desertimonas flava]